mgnify:CR=1 FL=1
MHTTDLPGKARAKTGAALTPDERRHEVAAIFAAGVLRLRSRPDIPPESTDSAAADGPRKSSDSARKALELCPPPRTHCPDG